MFLFFFGITLFMAGRDQVSYLNTEIYFKELHQQETLTEAWLLKELHLIPTDEPDYGNLIQLLDSKDEATRGQTIKRLERASDEALPLLVAAKKKAEADENHVMVAECDEMLETLMNKAPRWRVYDLMVVRALGEMKSQKALPHLEKLKKSKHPFMGEYARVAIARIKGQDYQVTRPTLKDMRGDLAFLPAQCKQMIQIDFSGGAWSAKRLAPVFDDVYEQTPSEILLWHVYDMSRSSGNYRIDGITLGYSNGLTTSAGYRVLVIRGEGLNRFLHNLPGFRSEQADIPDGDLMNEKVRAWKIEGGYVIFHAGVNEKKETWLPICEALEKRVMAYRSGQALTIENPFAVSQLKTLDTSKDQRSLKVWAAGDFSGQWLERDKTGFWKGYKGFAAEGRVDPAGGLAYQMTLTGKAESLDKRYEITQRWLPLIKRFTQLRNESDRLTLKKLKYIPTEERHSVAMHWHQLIVRMNEQADMIKQLSVKRKDGTLLLKTHSQDVGSMVFTVYELMAFPRSIKALGYWHEHYEDQIKALNVELEKLKNANPKAAQPVEVGG